MSLVDETVTAANGAVTTAAAAGADKLVGADEKNVVEMTDGVYLLRGWGIANTVAIDAPEGFIIVDTGDSTKTAKDMRSALEKHLGKEIKVAAILYTHSHYADGTDAWLDEGAEIYGHEGLDAAKRADTGVSVLSGNFGARAAAQFGMLTPPEGPEAFPNTFGLDYSKLAGEKSYRAPTKTFPDGETLQLTIAGEPVEVAPCYTDVADSVCYYFPNRSTLATNALGADTIFNLYTLRGEPYRDPLKYVAAADYALSKQAEVLADIHGPGHIGKDKVEAQLQLGRDQMQLIHDQSLRLIGQGLDARRVAESIYMPLHLRQGLELYGQVESHAKQVYNAQIGWMGNDVYDINPLTVNEEARRTVELMGGYDAVAAKARETVDAGGFDNWKWALRLTSYLLELDPDNAAARQTRADAARALGQRTTSSNARGWYITEALEREGKLAMGDQPVPSLAAFRAMLSKPSVEKIVASPTADGFQLLRYKVDPRKAEDAQAAFSVTVSDEGKTFGVTLRNGIVVISEDAEPMENHLEVAKQQWAEFLTGQRSFTEQGEVFQTFENALDLSS